MELYKMILMSIAVLSTLVTNVSLSVYNNQTVGPENFVLTYITNDCCISPIKIDHCDQLYNSVIVGDYKSAVSKCLKLENEGRGEIILNAVNRLLSDNKKNTVDFAYQLWNMFGKNIVKDYFPIQFRLLLNEGFVLIYNKRDGLPLNLDTVTDEGDRLTFGDGINKNSNQISWKAFTVWENNRVYFKFKNTYRHQYIKLEIRSNSAGDHKTWSADNHDTFRHQWYLQPVNCDNGTLFYIYNREYNKALKLSREVDAYGNRQLWGHNGNVTGNPEQFGWIIAPF